MFFWSQCFWDVEEMLPEWNQREMEALQNHVPQSQCVLVSSHTRAVR